jgi:hypothetical protein
MIRARTGIKLLRRLGIALIFAPEPFTTPFGVAFMLVARYLSRRHEASRNEHLRETVQYYLAHTGRFSDAADGESIAPGPVERYALSEERAILGQITGSRSFEANLAPSVLQNWQDMRGRTVHRTKDMQSLSPLYKAGDSFKVESGWADTSNREEKVIRHTLNREWPSQHYENENSAVAHSSWVTTSSVSEGVTHHFINMSLLSQHYKAGSVRRTKAKPHAIDIAQLRQRYGSAVNCTTALRAVQNNNCYYDILSRRNVIGGY